MKFSYPPMIYEEKAQIYQTSGPPKKMKYTEFFQRSFLYTLQHGPNIATPTEIALCLN